MGAPDGIGEAPRVSLAKLTLRLKNSLEPCTLGLSPHNVESQGGRSVVRARALESKQEPIRSWLCLLDRRRHFDLQSG